MQHGIRYPLVAVWPTVSIRLSLAQRLDVQSENLDMPRPAALIETTVAYNFIGMQFTATKDRFHECWSDTSEVVTPNSR